MKTKLLRYASLLGLLVLLPGCVAIPPLIQVQHKDGNDEVLRRLDAIDRRLDTLEKERTAK